VIEDITPLTLRPAPSVAVDEALGDGALLASRNILDEKELAV
jgi:hypothetical protein